MENKTKLSIRPSIDTLDNTRNTLSLENFQNSTLRPILKLQNNLIIAYFKHYLTTKKIDLTNFKKPSNKTALELIIKKDNTLKIELRTLIIANFTIEEYQLYLTNLKEFNKRIITMITQRIIDNLIKIKS